MSTEKVCKFGCLYDAEWMDMCGGCWNAEAPKRAKIARMDEWARLALAGICASEDWNGIDAIGGVGEWCYGIAGKMEHARAAMIAKMEDGK